MFKSGDALIVIDVQNDFCRGGALEVPHGDDVIPVLNEHIAEAQRQGIPIIATRDWHPADHSSFREQGGPWPAHCVQGSRGAEFHPSLQLPSNVYIVDKGSDRGDEGYSMFAGTGLADELRKRNVRRLWIGGLALDYCVRHTALDGVRAGFEVHLLADGTRPVNADTGAAALVDMANAGVTIESENGP